MVCSSCLRSVIVQTGLIGTILTPKRVHLPSIGIRPLYVGAGLTFWQNREFRKGVKMMVDSGATANQGPLVNSFPEKDDDGGYASGGWKRYLVVVFRLF